MIVKLEGIAEFLFSDFKFDDAGGWFSLSLRSILFYQYSEIIFAIHKSSVCDNILTIC